MTSRHTHLHRSSLHNLVRLIKINSINNIKMRHHGHIRHHDRRTRQVNNAKRQTRRHTRVLTRRNLIISITTGPIMFHLHQRITISRRPHSLGRVKVLTRLLSKMTPMTRSQPVTICRHSLQFTLHHNRRTKVGHSPTIVTRLKSRSTVQTNQDLSSQRHMLVQVRVGFDYHRTHSLVP